MFLRPNWQMRGRSRWRVPMMVLGATGFLIAILRTSGLGTTEMIILTLILLAIGIGVGYMLRFRDDAEKHKNEEWVEKKKKRLENVEYARTSDGDVLEVVEDDDNESRRASR